MKTAEKKAFMLPLQLPRYIGGAAYYANKLHADFQILTDGTLVYQNGKLIYSRTMSVDMTNNIIDELKNYGLHLTHSNPYNNSTLQIPLQP